MTSALMRGTDLRHNVVNNRARSVPKQNANDEMLRVDLRC